MCFINNEKKKKKKKPRLHFGKSFALRNCILENVKLVTWSSIMKLYLSVSSNLWWLNTKQMDSEENCSKAGLIHSNQFKIKWSAEVTQKSVGGFQELYERNYLYHLVSVVLILTGLSP